MTGTNLGNLFIVAAPSGGGKTSLVKHLVDRLDDIVVSVSYTTRPKRPGEQDGVDYYFVSESEFINMVNDNAFVEHARVFNYFYGTSQQQISDKLNKGLDVVLDIDWQGAAQIRRLFPESIGIFVLPPSIDALKERLEKRGQDDDRVITDRMHQSQDEMSHYGEFDYLIVNETFEKAADDLRAIVVSNRLKIDRQINKESKLLSFLLSSQ